MIFSRSIVCLLFLFSTGLLAQDAKTVFEKYSKAALNIQTVSYTVQCIDTFLTGDVWNKTGWCAIRRDTSNKIGFAFSGKPADKPNTCFYDGQAFYNFDENTKTYTVRNRPGYEIIGTSAGQLVSKELFLPPTGFDQLSLTVQPDCYELKLQFPDLKEYDVTNRYRLLCIDKKTFLPKKVVNAQQSLDKRQVLTWVFSDVKVNDRKTNRQLDHTGLLAAYKLKTETPRAGSDKNPLDTLKGQMAADFSLQTFNGDTIQLEKLKGKLVLLDFWEVWCGPCIESLPKVQALHEKYAGKGLTVLGVTLDKKILSSNKLFAEKKKLPFPNLIGDAAVKTNYKVEGIPEYILIDKTGKIIFAHAGFTDAIENMIREQLGD